METLFLSMDRIDTLEAFMKHFSSLLLDSFINPLLTAMTLPTGGDKKLVKSGCGLIIEKSHFSALIRLKEVKRDNDAGNYLGKLDRM